MCHQLALIGLKNILPALMTKILHTVLCFNHDRASIYGATTCGHAVGHDADMLASGGSLGTVVAFVWRLFCTLDLSWRPSCCNWRFVSWFAACVLAFCVSVTGITLVNQLAIGVLRRLCLQSLWFGILFLCLLGDLLGFLRYILFAAVGARRFCEFEALPPPCHWR